MIKNGVIMEGATVTILGFTFKENVPDIRNTRVIDIITELQSFGIKVQVTDAYANPKEVQEEYGLTLTNYEDLTPSDAAILAVPHNTYVEEGWNLFNNLLTNGNSIVFDIKSTLDKNSTPKHILLRRL